MPKHTCCYWLTGNVEQCGKPTKYKIVRDDDNNKVRKYDAFCPEHRAIVDASPPSDDEDFDEDGFGV